jgi:hypothetical protein
MLPFNRFSPKNQNTRTSTIEGNEEGLGRDRVRPTFGSCSTLRAVANVVEHLRRNAAGVLLRLPQAGRISFRIKTRFSSDFQIAGPEGLGICLASCPYPPSSSSSSFVLGGYSGGRSETPATCFLYASFFHSGKPPRSLTDEDEPGRLGQCGKQIQGKSWAEWREDKQDWDSLLPRRRYRSLAQGFNPGNRPPGRRALKGRQVIVIML